MALSLALLHPAFSLSQTPMMVLLAFIMVGLAVFVMLILYARFDAGLQKLVEEAQGVESSEGSRKMLAGVAFSVGVNNMRRRVIRTTLTAATIVLVTFTMLSVISVGESLVPYRRKTEANVPYNGVLFAKPGMAPISASTALSVVGLFQPYGTVVRRTWTQRLDSYGGYLRQPVTDPANPGKSSSVNALVGVAEGGGRFPRAHAARGGPVVQQRQRGGDRPVRGGRFLPRHRESSRSSSGRWTCATTRSGWWGCWTTRSWRRSATWRG